MKKRRNVQLFTLGSVSLLLTLALFSASMAGATVGNQAEPEPDVRITALVVYEFPPFFYEIHCGIHNYEDYDVAVVYDNTLIYPNGTEHKVAMGPNVVPANADGGISIFCMYPPRLCGTYTWVVTLRDAAGVVLDEKSVSWERDEFLRKIPILF